MLCGCNRLFGCHKGLLVAILLVVEYALRIVVYSVNQHRHDVAILLVMEYAQREIKYYPYHIKQSRNPSCNGICSAGRTRPHLLGVAPLVVTGLAP